MSKLPEEIVFVLRGKGFINPRHLRIPTPIKGVFAVTRLKKCSTMSEAGEMEEMLARVKEANDYLGSLKNGEDFNAIMEHMQLLYGDPVLMDFNNCINDITKDLGVMPDEMSVEEMDTKIPNSYIVTNSSKLAGAICMFDKGIYEQLNSLFPDGYTILPSSIHEVIVMPLMEDSFDDLNEMVQEINEREVLEQDALCNYAIMFKNNEYKMLC